MTSATPISVPEQRLPLVDVEQEVARTADLVLKLAALADRYERSRADPQRVARMRAVVDRGVQALRHVAQDE